MDTDNLNDAPRRGSCSSQAQRPNAGLARRLVSLLTTAGADDVEMVRALALLTASDVIRDVEDPDEAITRDGPFALVTIRLPRVALGWQLDVVVQAQVHAFEDSEDHTDVSAVALRHGLHTIAIDARCELTPGEADYVTERLEAARVHVRQQCHDDRIEACSGVR